MDAATISRLAHEIATAQLSDWRFWLLLIGLVVISTALSALIHGYFSKRGEVSGTQAELKRILSQLSAQTDAVKRVETAISHDDWVQREWKTISRVKLEEFVEAAQKVRLWLDREFQIRILAANGANTDSPFWKVDALCCLYFPQFRSEVEAFRAEYQALASFVVSIQLQRGEAAGWPSSEAEVEARLKSEYLPLHNKVIQAIHALEVRAQQAMKEVAPSSFAAN